MTEHLRRIVIGLWNGRVSDRTPGPFEVVGERRTGIWPWRKTRTEVLQRYETLGPACCWAESGIAERRGYRNVCVCYAERP